MLDGFYIFRNPQITLLLVLLGIEPCSKNQLFGMVLPLGTLLCSKNLSSRTPLFGSTLLLVSHSIYLRGI